MGATKFADLPVVETPWGDEVKNQNEILGDPPDWERYRKAFLWYDPDNAESKAGYKLMIAKVVDGQLKVVWSQLTNRIAVINGARAPVDISDADKRACYSHAVKYYKKHRPDAEPPALNLVAPKGTVRGARRMGLALAAVPLVVALAAADAEAEASVWSQVAEEGEYRGYANGAQPAMLDAALFQQLVENFRRHPSYRQVDGVGAADVIPWDFHHASEHDGADGAVPVAGAPAQGWVQELEVRYVDNKAQLWALTRWLEPARSYIREGKYRWASIAFSPDAVDARSGLGVGAVLTSIALTNQPFIEGMQALAASRGAIRAAARLSSDLDQAIARVRGWLGLPVTADLATILAELQKLRQWTETGSEPLGVDLDAILNDLRWGLNLPTLATSDDIFAELDKLAARLVIESGVGDEGTGGQPPAAAPAVEAPAAPEANMTILKTIAEKLGVVETEAAVLEAIDQHVTLREQMGKNLGLEKTTGMRVLLRAAVDNEAVRGKYVAILGALGVENPEQGLDRIAEMIQQAEQLKKLAPEFEALRVKQAKLEEAEAEADVDEVMAERKWTDKGLRICLLEKRKSSVEEFRKLYPKPEPDKVHLTKQVVDKGAGVDAASGGKVIKLSAYAGRNRTERAMAFVKANVAGADQFTFEELHEQGCRLLHSGQVED